MFNAMKMIAIFLILLGGGVRKSLQQDNSLLVTLPNGQIRGRELQSTQNNVYYAFQEIPYAAPPIGDMRYKEPVAPAMWKGILNTTKNTKICYQSITSSTPNVTETEDCLYLNVYTPLKPGDNNSSDLLPVLFWIYGGSFIVGDGTYQLHGPGHFMDYDIIVVTINYRLGPLGFLTTEDGIIPGNLGLKDQNFALNWTHQNIQLFGGDPEKITIVGQSAGASSVGYQVLSKRSTGLFRGAILQSGTSICSWARQPFARYYAYQMGSALSSNFNENNSSQQLLHLLLNSSASDIINANITVTPGMENGLGINQQMIWAPVIEDENQHNAFVVGPMEDNLKKGNFNQIPILIGFNSEEIIYFFRGLEEPHLSEYLTLFARYFDEDLSRLINNKYNMTIEDKIKSGGKLRKIYTDDNFADHLSAVVKFYSDQSHTTPESKHAELQSNYTDVYLYQFSYKGELGGTNPTIEGTDNVGHTEELMYMWDFHTVDINTMPKSDILTHNRLLTLWTNFIKLLNPTPIEDPLLENVTWPKVSPDNMIYLNINMTLDVKSDPKKYKEWKQIIEAYAIPPLINY